MELTNYVLETEEEIRMRVNIDKDNTYGKKIIIIIVVITAHCLLCVTCYEKQSACQLH